MRGSRRVVPGQECVALRVNGFQIRDNNKKGEREPCIVAHLDDGEDVACRGVIMTGPGRILQNFDTPLDRGPLPANVWIVSDHPVVLVL